MKIINLVLASGLGKRLYPLSTEEKPKQFLKLISENMMVEDTLSRFRPFVDESYLVTLEKYEKYVDEIENISVVYEEEREESGMSVYRALSQIWEDYGDSETIIIQTPSDHYIEENESFMSAINKAIFYAQNNWVSVVGAEPLYSTGEYGYLKNFHAMEEKPTRAVAKNLIASGYRWNTAIYAYNLKNMLFTYELIFKKRGKSFEREILQQIMDIVKVVPADIVWNDVGTPEGLERYQFERWKKEEGRKTYDSRPNKSGV